MSTDFTMPTLGADMESGTLLEWLVAPGDPVHRGQVVAVVDTAKSAIEIESFADGVVERLVVEPGTEVPVGTVLAVFGTDRTTSARAEPAPAPTPPAAATPLVRQLAHRLDVDLAGVVGTGKGGRITHDDVERAAAGRRPVTVPQPRRAEVLEPAAAVPTPTSTRQRVSPLARRRAAELGVDLAAVTGTGAEGAVTDADVQRAAAPAQTEPAPVEPAPAPAPTPAPTPAPAATPDRAAAMRAAVGALMSRSKREIPHYYLAHTVDLAAATAWLLQHNAGLPVASRVLPAALFLRATAVAAHQVPQVNGHFVDGALVPCAQVHLGVAVNLRGGGLVTPALHDADTLDVDATMAALRDVVARARSGHLHGGELSDGTITVTSLGERGVELVQGVIVPPQVALVGFGAVVRRPWAVDDMLTVRPVVTVTFSGDHRAGDGHLGARFLALVGDLLQRPEDL